MRFVVFGFVMAAGLWPSLVEGQTLSFFKTLPGPNNQGSIMLVDASGVYSFGDTIRKYDLDGAAVWSREHPRVQTVAWLASTSAGVYAAGHFPPHPLRIEGFVGLYDVQGNEVWNQPIRFADSVTINRSVAADETGVYVAGTLSPNTSHYLRKYNPQGTELWTKRLDDLGVIAVDSSGIYISTARSIRKYDRNGDEVWVRALEGSIQPYNMKANATGVYLTGHQNGKGYFLARYDSSGNEVWIRYGQSGWIALDANSIYVTALAFQESGQCASGLADIFVVRYDTDGKVLWTRQFGTYEDEYPQAIAAGANGVFVTGFGSGRSFLAKLNPVPAGALTSEPSIRNECVLNAASNIGGAVSPGEIVTIFGTAIGPSQVASARADRAVGTELGGTRVLFDGIPAPLFYASSEQVRAVVPNSVATKSSVNIHVEYRGTLSKALTLPVLKAHPGILNVLNENGTPNSPGDPARRGSIISIYGTGGGETDPATPDGHVVTIPPPRLNAKVRVIFPSADEDSPGIEAEVTYAGAAPGFVGGLLQVNARLPESSPIGSVLLGLTVGDGDGNSPLSVRISVADK